MAPLADRSAGFLVPLFALRADSDWGIGDLSLLPRFAQWVAAAGHRRIQLLPICEIPHGERSPYSALSAFAIDPIYIALPRLEDFHVAGGEDAMPPAVHRRLRQAQAAAAIDYDSVRDTKRVALRLAFDAFERTEAAGDSARGRAFETYRVANASWLEGYTLYRSLATARGQGAWDRWEPALRDRERPALAASVATTASSRRFHAYVQWVADVQLAAARAASHAAKVLLDGDLPFMVSRASSDVWERQGEFDCRTSLGAPPDAFNAEGQDWGLPPWNWDGMVAVDFAWLRARIAAVAAHYDGARLDHAVGFFRQWVRPAQGPAAFVPTDPVEQRRRGQRVLDLIRRVAPNVAIMAEDLGDVPAFVRQVLSERGIPGYRVLRWEWDGDIPRDPRSFPRTSVATWGTHDTSSLMTWWTTELDADARRRVAGAPGYEAVQAAAARGTSEAQGLLAALYGAGSNTVIMPFPDTYAGEERINLPGTVSEANWDYRLPWRLEDDASEPLRAMAQRLRTLCADHGRLTG